MASEELMSKAENAAPDGTEWLYSQLQASPYTVQKIQLDNLADYIASKSTTPAGTVIESAAISAPTGYLPAKGGSYSRTTYSTLFGAISEDKGTVTISIATPGVVSLSTHGLSTGHCIELTTSGALPTGLSANTNYYVIYNDANSFWLATSYANALAGTKIDTSGTQSGTHNLTFVPYGINGADQFYVPNRQAVVGKGSGTQDINGRTKVAPVLGAIIEDTGQGFGFGSSGAASTAGTGDHIYSARAGQYGFGARSANAGAFQYITTMGGSNLIGNDGTNGDPRQGLQTQDCSIGMNYYIKY